MAIQCQNTGHYRIQYDDATNPSTGQFLASDLCQNAEDDFRLMQGWFQGVSSIPTNQLPIAVTIVPNQSSGGIARRNNNTVTIWVPNRMDAQNAATVRWLLIGEITEMFMFYSGMGWFGGLHFGDGNEGSVGEGLSIFLSQQWAQMHGFQINLPNSFPANNWLGSSDRPIEPQTLSFTDPWGPTNKPFLYAGFYLLFLYYLKDQLRYTINQIIANGPSTATGTIAEVYHKLTGNPNDPFPAFLQLINSRYPGSQKLADNLYSPFPISTPTCPNGNGWSIINGEWVFCQNGAKQGGWHNGFFADSNGVWAGFIRLANGNIQYRPLRFRTLPSGDPNALTVVKGDFACTLGQWWFFDNNGNLVSNNIVGWNPQTRQWTVGQQGSPTHRLGSNGACQDCGPPCSET
ncbi:hypothetical protein [Bacillus paramycoides]|uniref:hypothetical protein n=1 Tax=Bacillus paramycoides TaxID=2026194 RepID=UPI003D0882A9